MTDCTVAMDDGLVGQLLHCTAGGARCRGTGWFDMWTHAGLTVAIMWCDHCRADPAARAAVEPLMQERYKTRGEGQEKPYES